MKQIVVAGGCFWGVEEYYRRIKGILSTKVGYSQGDIENPSYEQVKTSLTNHREVVLLSYDESIISLKHIIDLLFRIIDPTIKDQQGDDIGSQYQCGIYYIDDGDLNTIMNSVNEMKKHYDKQLTIEIEKLRCFYDAEEYHQLYLVKNPSGYCHVDFSKIKEDELK